MKCLRCELLQDNYYLIQRENQQLRSEVERLTQELNGLKSERLLLEHQRDESYEEGERLRQACKAARKRILFLRHDLTDPIVAQLDSALNTKGTPDAK